MIGFWFGIGVILAARIVNDLDYCTEELMSIKYTKMSEQSQVQQVMMKDPKKVEVGKRLAEYNRRKREELAQLKSESKQVEPKLTYYGAGAIVAIGALGVLGYYV